MESNLKVRDHAALSIICYMSIIIIIFMIVVVALIFILGQRQGLYLVILLLKEVVTIIDLAAEELIKEIASSFTYFLAY